MEILELSQCSNLKDDIIQYFWNCWGSETNFPFYKDCMDNSLNPENALPKFYVCLDGTEIIGSYALLVNDSISRRDLMPWFACLHVNEANRGNGIAGKLLDHALTETKSKGFESVYLSTDLVDFYEKKGWKLFSHAYNVTGEKFKVYAKKVIESA